MIDIRLVLFPRGGVALQEKWPCVPNRGDIIFYDGHEYDVVMVRHDFDCKQINVYIKRS